MYVTSGTGLPLRPHATLQPIYGQGRSTRYGCYGFGRTTYYSIYPCMANLCILFHDIAIQF